ncbi:uncharacterized protein BYT42DRAFT_611641 [Radiomyces spectabilis]|uniref:uncharacterized protein n=1 Tax=Radiomyces spectabilis TaxID=64574 RepID=UPI0022210EDE|nr:uncharacterized protein BYT42DRAFT_611641 [Radiomyces spectabilis]KAI8388620.1 hypothetical protein BYT42DRAFT_611641 [Radiomyces spectabilis]
MRIQAKRGRSKNGLFRAQTDRHLDEYLEITGYERPNFKFAQQTAPYEGAKIYVAYMNNVQMRFGQHLRRLEEDRIRQLINEAITVPARRFKEAIKSQSVNRKTIPQNLLIYMNAYHALRPVLDAYDRDYWLGEGNIYYDVKIRPNNHFEAFYQLDRLFSLLGQRSFNCIPLWRSWSPCYVQIDSKILCQNIMKKNRVNGADKPSYWRQVVDLDAPVFKNQEDGELQFRGTIQTDVKEVSKYVTDLTVHELQAMSGRCVVVDPGRRDIVLCTRRLYPDRAHQVPVYVTASRQDVEDQKVLSQHSSRNISIDEHVAYLGDRSDQSEILSDFYRDTITNHDTENLLFRKLRLSKYINKEKASQQLIRDLTDTFGEDAVFVIGNWSAPNTLYHEPIRGLGFRRLLTKHGFRVLLIDEFKTSKCCPTCRTESLKSFKQVRNPRSYRRQQNPLVLCHGLLRCTNQTCFELMALYRRGFTEVDLQGVQEKNYSSQEPGVV